MNLDYFQLIDRIVDLNLEARTITVEAHVPEKHTIFEGHFPGFPIMPGVLLTEAMAQSCGWLILGVLKFERMPFLAIVKEAKMRGSVSPGRRRTMGARLDMGGSGLAVARARAGVARDLNASVKFPSAFPPSPIPPCACTWMRWPTRSASRCRRSRNEQGQGSL